MKLMMVGYQKMGKTTILSRLCETHERVTPSTTFLQRVTGEEPPSPKTKGKRTGQLVVMVTMIAVLQCKWMI